MNLKLENIGLGAVAEKFDDELLKVIDNTLDPNTEAKKVREINIKVRVSPNPDNRELCSMEVLVSSKLAPTRKLVSQITIGMDRRTGAVDAIEYVPKQTDLFPGKKPEMKVVNLTQ